MRKVPVHLVVACFDGPITADVALKALISARDENLLVYKGAAVVWRDHKEKVHIDEPADPGGRQGARAGGIIGAVIGLIAGPAGVVVGGATGALVGGLAGEAIDTGISNKRMREIGKNLKPGGSALVVLSEEGWTKQVRKLLKKIGATVTVETVKGEAAEKLAGNKEP
jgi:uncharacterized membrane protein